MKPNVPSEPSTPKSTLSKSLKKPRSKSKGSKSNSQPTTSQQQQCHDYVSTPGSSDYFKEKGHHKSYSGFEPKTVKIFWEQHDTTDTVVMPDVYPQLAEDATYKLWEIVNTAKTYARHSGGRVTSDIINEVLKDSDVPPILGAIDHDWEKIEYDGTFYFNKDEDLDLREEYLREESDEVPTTGEITASWSLDRKYSKVLLEFSSKLCSAIFLGDDETFKYALDVATFAPQVGCTLKIILKKCIEMIAFEQKPKTTRRCMALLRALAFNTHSRDVECREQLFHLAELLVCLILGPDIKGESFELVANYLHNPDTESKKDTSTFNQIDVDDIRNAYEALFQMMERDGFQEQDNANTANGDDVKIEQHDGDIRLSGDGNVNSGAESGESNVRPKQENIQGEFSPYKTQMVEEKDVDSVYLALGDLSSQFGYFQNECTFLIEKRMEKFFKSKKPNDLIDYKLICRTVQALITLGEYATRELIPYLQEIDPFLAPEWICNYFSPAAIFLNGRDDIFLYEWLEALCGHKLQPFMIHFYRYLEEFNTKQLKSLRKSTYTIHSKIILRLLDIKVCVAHNLAIMFPDLTQMRAKPKQVGFRFAGCRPVPLKTKQIKPESVNVYQKSLDLFNSKVVIGRRKLLKPLSDRKKFPRFSNYCLLQL